MYQIKVYEKVNAIFGVLKGDFTVIELKIYYDELVLKIRERLKENFVYMIDLSEFYTGGIDGSDSVDREMGEIRYKLEELGMKEFFIIGGGMKTFYAIRNEEKNNNSKAECMFFENIEKAIDHLSKSVT